MDESTALAGRRFRPSDPPAGGEVEPDTIFIFHEAEGVVWAEYSGGPIQKGFLVGVRQADVLDFRYVQLNTEGQTSTGHSVDSIQVGANGRLELHESWEWESKPGAGTSVLVEILSSP